MSKTSVVTRVISLAALMALLLASFPTASVVAKGNNQGLETKWEQLVTNYDRQSMTHNSVHHWAERWMNTNRNASDSKKAEIERHLRICNSALAKANVIVLKHAGFDANGKVVDRGLARQSVKDLAYNLQQHAASVRNLEAHFN